MTTQAALNGGAGLLETGDKEKQFLKLSVLALLPFINILYIYWMYS